MLQLPVFVDEDIQSSHARVTVAREVKVTVGTERGEHLVASGIDGLAQILYGTRLSMTQQTAAPDVETSHTSWHIAHEVEPFTVRTDGGMGIAVERVFRDGEFPGLSPGSIRSVGYGDGRIARIVGVSLTQCQIHRLPIRLEATGTFVEAAVQLRVDTLGLAPFPLVVFLRHEDVGSLCTRNTAIFIALCLIACGGEVELVVLVASQHG